MNISMVTLGVADLARSIRFYAALGWRNSEMSNENVAFLVGSDIVLGLLGREALAKDAGVSAEGEGFCAVALALTRGSREEVNAFFQRATLAGGSVVKRPQEVFWGGYSGYFADPDGHLWEVAHNPFVNSDANGRWHFEVACEPVNDDEPGDAEMEKPA